MSASIRSAVEEVRANGFLSEETQSRMTPAEIALALNLAGA